MAKTTKEYHPKLEEKKQITKTHIKNLFKNGKVQKIVTDMRLTDDYAFDAADNFGKGQEYDIERFYKYNVIDYWYYRCELVKTTAEHYFIRLYNSFEIYTMVCEK